MVAFSQINIGRKNEDGFDRNLLEVFAVHSTRWHIASPPPSTQQLDKTFVGGKHRISHTYKQKIFLKCKQKEVSNISALTEDAQGKKGILAFLSIASKILNTSKQVWWLLL